MGADAGESRVNPPRDAFVIHQVMRSRQLGLGVVVITVILALLNVALPVGATSVQNRMSPSVMAAASFPSGCLRTVPDRNKCDSGTSEDVSPAWGTSDDVIFLIAAIWIVSVGGLLLVEHVRSQISRV
jgi:hypothetical protein